jgi:glycosyltransferase involved in cell wall biosynthesis
MELGIFCDSFFPENKAVAVRLFHIAQALSKQPGVNVTINTSTRKTDSSTSNFRIRRNLIPTPSNEASNIMRLLNELLLGIEMFFVVLFSSYQLIIFSSPPFLASFFGVLAARIRRKPYVFDVRDEYPEVFFTSGLLKETSPPGKILLAIEKSIYKNAFLVITVTDGICKRIDLKVGQENFTQLVRNGYDETKFFPSAEKENEFTIVFHGNLGKFQDPKLIVSLAERALLLGKKFNFVVIGFGGMDGVLKKNKLTNLKFLGMVRYEDIPSLIARANVGISFRTDETISKNSFPVKLYEYIGVGIPVIITPISEAGDFFESNNLGFQFDPKEEDSIFQKLVELSENHDERNQIAEKILKVRYAFSRQMISNHFAKHLINSFLNRVNS